MTQPTKTTFYSLPAELRNEIYTHALLQQTPIILPYAYEKRPFIEPPLLSASSLIRAEASPVFYGGNTFSAPSPPSAYHFLHQLSKENIRQLRCFRPIDLILPLSAQKRWYDALRANINRLVVECGKGVLGIDAVMIPVRKEDHGIEIWVRISDIEDFEVVWSEAEGVWWVQWREGFGREDMMG